MYVSGDMWDCPQYVAPECKCNSLCAQGPTMHTMDMQQDDVAGRLPTSHPRRIELRDIKMWRRESERQLRSGSRTSRCPCTLCLFGRPLLRTTQAKHLRDYGRHPVKRLQEEVKHILLVVYTFPAIQLHDGSGMQDGSYHGSIQDRVTMHP